MAKIKLIIVGGFLGAGKTTLMSATRQFLQDKGKKVGLITNDQATGLVDTLILSTNGVDVQEIAGSCFCCNFDGMMKAALYLRDSAQCDTIIAEPVGSCTDLSATLMQPVKAYYHQYFDLAPLSVLTDPFQLTEMLKDNNKGIKGSGYIYLKQLEETDHLIVNKTDLLSETENAELKRLLKKRFPDYPVHWISARQQTGIENWLVNISSDSKAGSRIADVDYDIYAEGEALMGWYNASFFVEHSKGRLLPWKEFNIMFLQLIQMVFQREGIVMGHMKTFLKSGPSHINSNLTNTHGEISARGESFSSQSARMILNIRAEVVPELLKEIVDDIIEVLKEHKIMFKIIELKYLVPKRPQPTHRMDCVL